MTTEELIALAALTSYSCGDCKSLYDEDTLEEEGMTSDEMQTFLAKHSKRINEVEGRILEKVTELATEIT
jgi:hypothetical protein